jgi:hypothetical protein
MPKGVTFFTGVVTTRSQHSFGSQAPGESDLNLNDQSSALVR